MTKVVKLLIKEIFQSQIIISNIYNNNILEIDIMYHLLPLTASLSIK